MTTTPPSNDNLPAVIEHVAEFTEEEYPDETADPRGETESLVETFKRLGAQVPPGGVPMPVLAGTFVMYPAADGGAVVVMENSIGPTGPGTQRMKVNPAVVRAIDALASGKGKGAVLRAVMRAIGGR